MGKIIVLYLIVITFVYGNNGQETKNLKKGERRFYEIKSEINESIEQKVFKNQKNKNEATKEGFKTADERLDFLFLEEAELIKLEKELGITTNENNKFNGEEFKKIYEKFTLESNSLEKLKLENLKLNQYLNRLNTIEKDLE